MGVVECERHGKLGGGPLLCDHLLAAVYGSGRSDSGTGAVRFSVDMLDDGQHYLVFFACRECSARFHLDDGAIVSSEAWKDDTRFPDSTPVCAVCFGSWANAVGLSG